MGTYRRCKLPRCTRRRQQREQFCWPSSSRITEIHTFRPMWTELSFSVKFNNYLTFFFSVNSLLWKKNSPPINILSIFYDSFLQPPIKIISIFLFYDFIFLKKGNLKSRLKKCSAKISWTYLTHIHVSNNYYGKKCKNEILFNIHDILINESQCRQFFFTSVTMDSPIKKQMKQTIPVKISRRFPIRK